MWEAGFKKMTVNDLGGRHVNYLVDRWKREALAVGTIKNRMTTLRWWGEKVNRPMMRAENGAYGIGKRTLVTNISKSKSLPAKQLALVTDERVRLSLELQREFGLRREESLKFRPSYADRGDRIALKASWTKGGRAREIPILTPAQREVLNRAHALAGLGSLIPIERNYIQQVKIYERQTAAAKLSKMHGLRHCDAQRRYEELTGWQSLNNDGPNSKALTPEQKRVDRSARLQISQELGHGRESITAVYLGR